MSVHDENSPSVLFRRLLCPGSRRMEREMPDDAGPAAIRGRILHSWAAHRLQPTLFPAPIEPLTDPENDLITYYIGAVRSFAPTASGLIVEHRLSLQELGIIEGGTIDAAWVDLSAGTGVVHDLKTGQVAVKPPAINWQLIAYAFGLMTNFGLNQVDAIVIQPLLDQDARIRVARFTRERLWSLSLTIEDGIAATEDPAAPLIPGPEQCEYCRARFKCEARNAAVAATQTYGALVNREAVRGMTPAQRGYWWPRIVEARKRLEEIEDLFSTSVIDEGMDVEGFAIIAGKRGNRKWTNPEAALDTGRAIALSAGIDPDRLIEMRIKSPGEFDEVLGKSKPVRDRLEPLITQTDGKPKLAQRAIA